MNYWRKQEIKVLHWPSQSPDLNITEYVRLYLKGAEHKNDL